MYRTKQAIFGKTLCQEVLEGLAASTRKLLPRITSGEPNEAGYNGKAKQQPLLLFCLFREMFGLKGIDKSLYGYVS